jgi:hypothetical protein
MTKPNKDDKSVQKGKERLRKVSYQCNTNWLLVTINNETKNKKKIAQKTRKKQGKSAQHHTTYMTKKQKQFIGGVKY